MPNSKFYFELSEFESSPKVRFSNFYKFECWSKVRFTIQIQFWFKDRGYIWIFIKNSKKFKNWQKNSNFQVFWWKFKFNLHFLTKIEFWGSKSSILGPKKFEFWSKMLDVRVQKWVWVQKSFEFKLWSKLKKNWLKNILNFPNIFEFLFLESSFALP